MAAESVEYPQLQRARPFRSFDHHATRVDFGYAPTLRAFRRVSDLQPHPFPAACRLQDRHLQLRRDQHAGQDEVESLRLFAAFLTGDEKRLRLAALGKQRTRGDFGILGQRSETFRHLLRKLRQRAHQAWIVRQRADLSAQAEQGQHPHQQRPAGQRGQQPTARPERVNSHRLLQVWRA